MKKPFTSSLSLSLTIELGRGAQLDPLPSLRSLFGPPSSLRCGSNPFKNAAAVPRQGNGSFVCLSPSMELVLLEGGEIGQGK